MSSATTSLLIEVTDRIATVTLHRPEALNAIDLALQRSLVEAFAEFDRDDGVDVVVLTSSGERAFSAGADLKELSGNDKLGERPYLPMTGPLRNLYETVLECRKPTLAAMRGWVVGAGLELALACDLRIAGEDARFMLPESKVGLGANFGSQMLPRIIPAGLAYQMLYLGEPVEAAEAHRIGLVNWVVPTAELATRAAGVARDLAARAPLTLRRYKAMIQIGSTLPISTALRLDTRASPYTSEDRAEGAAAFLERRPPHWKGR